MDGLLHSFFRAVMMASDAPVSVEAPEKQAEDWRRRWEYRSSCREEQRVRRGSECFCLLFTSAHH